MLKNKEMRISLCTYIYIIYTFILLCLVVILITTHPCFLFLKEGNRCYVLIVLYTSIVSLLAKERMLESVPKGEFS